MLSTNKQEAIVVQSFFDELVKNAAFFPKLRARFSSEASLGKDVGAAINYQRHLETEMLKNDVTVESGKAALDSLSNGMASSKTTKAVAADKEKKKTLVGAAAALGLGSLGFGYYQYKKNEDDQLARRYTQVS